MVPPSLPPSSPKHGICGPTITATGLPLTVHRVGTGDKAGYSAVRTTNNGTFLALLSVLPTVSVAAMREINLTMTFRAIRAARMANSNTIGDDSGQDDWHREMMVRNESRIPKKVVYRFGRPGVLQFCSTFCMHGTRTCVRCPHNVHFAPPMPYRTWSLVNRRVGDETRGGEFC